MTADERIFHLLAQAGVDFPTMPEDPEKRQARCSDYAHYVYQAVTGREDKDDGNVMADQLIGAMAVYGVHMTDLVDRLEWALENALAANRALGGRLDRAELFGKAIKKKAGRKTGKRGRK